MGRYSIAPSRGECVKVPAAGLQLSAGSAGAQLPNDGD
jgi:hypothetical protein